MELKPQIRVKIQFLITQYKNYLGVRLRELFPVDFVDIPLIAFPWSEYRGFHTRLRVKSRVNTRNKCKDSGLYSIPSSKTLIIHDKTSLGDYTLKVEFDNRGHTFSSVFVTPLLTEEEWISNLRVKVKSRVIYISIMAKSWKYFVKLRRFSW